MAQRVIAQFGATQNQGSEFLTEVVSLAPGAHASKTVAKLISAFEVAMLDIQGQLAGAPVVDVLGGASRNEVPFSAYLFFKYADHIDATEPADAWGECITPAQMVGQAQRMVNAHGFKSIKLKAGVFDPDHELQVLLELAKHFPSAPLRIDPNANWSVATGLRMAERLAGVLEYLEDPVPGLDGMAEIAKHHAMPLATNMVVTNDAEWVSNVRRSCPVRIVLSDHHYWGGLRATLALGRMCQLFDLGLSMHSNSHLGVSLMAMTHLAAASPQLSYACDTHYPWQDDEVIAGGKLRFESGALKVPQAPGLGVTLDPVALQRLHANYLACGIRQRDDLAQMRKYQPGFSGKQPRF
jgi:glucarate dehydratase